MRKQLAIALLGVVMTVSGVLSGPAYTALAAEESGTGEQEDGGQAENPGEPVIVAENGVVYHTDPDCVYLKPHVHEVDASELGTLRANDGSIYHPCEYCHPSQHGTVFITPDGNRYHSSRDCSRLLRTTHEETAEEASKHLRPCPKCGGKH